MSALAERFVAAFTKAAVPLGWRVADVEDDEFIAFAKPIESGLHAELGLDLFERDFGLSLDPTVSVRHIHISEMHAQFFGFEQGASQVAASLSDIVRAAGLGGGVLWPVESAAAISAGVSRILGDVSRWGEPFFAQYSNVSAIVRHLEDSATSNLDLAQLAVAFGVAGESAKTAPVISRLREMAEDQPPLIATQTRRFLAAFQERFGD